jgi:hypothetical protein
MGAEITTQGLYDPGEFLQGSLHVTVHFLCLYFSANFLTGLFLSQSPGLAPLTFVIK